MHMQNKIKIIKIKKKKLVKPQVSEAVSISLIYADLIQHKRLFKYNIIYFWQILDIHTHCKSFLTLKNE